MKPLLTLCSTAALLGCATIAEPPRFGAAHPASPQAETTAFSPPASGLASGPVAPLGAPPRTAMDHSSMGHGGMDHSGHGGISKQDGMDHSSHGGMSDPGGMDHSGHGGMSDQDGMDHSGHQMKAPDKAKQQPGGQHDHHH